MVFIMRSRPILKQAGGLRVGSAVPPRGVRHICRAGRRSERQPRRENVPGDFYVDQTCIDCDTCRWMAPSVFSRVGEMSAVVRQPEGTEERQEALRALLSCPTFSIHVDCRAPGEMLAAQASLPQLIPGCSGVYHCGYHSESSYGATPYLILRHPQPATTTAAILADRDNGDSSSSSGSGSTDRGDGRAPREAAAVGTVSSSRSTALAPGQAASSSPLPEELAEGNIMVDVPRWSPGLAKQLEQMGGVSWIVLTHQDDVAGHDAWAKHFGAARVIHQLEASEWQGTDAAEWKLEGEGPWKMGPGVELIFTPGHTAGSVSLLFKPDRALLTGDHLAYSHALGRLSISRAYNWHSVAQQVESVHKLLPLDFLHILPGHGRRASFTDRDHKDRELWKLLMVEGWKTEKGKALSYF